MSPIILLKYAVFAGLDSTSYKKFQTKESLTATGRTGKVRGT